MVAMSESRRTRDCQIEQVGKARNGKPRYWCLVHGASATGHYGVRLAQCESAYRDTAQLGEALNLRENDYPGGIALWGVVAPVYDTTGREPERGVHVHARYEEGGKKPIDATYPAVVVSYNKGDLFTEGRVLISQEAAVSYYIAKFLGHPVDHLFCVKCGELHLDADYFAVHPHRKHLCHGCGKYFKDPSGKSVSNPIAYLPNLRADARGDRGVIRPSRQLDIDQSRYPGGVQIWASNPAILWTQNKLEEVGIHVHLYGDDKDAPVVDETFGVVRIDGVELDEDMVGHLMAQRSLQYLANKVVSLSCPKCGSAHFDKGENAFYPHHEHICETCDARFAAPGRRRKVVSNPLVDILDRLRESADR